CRLSSHILPTRVRKSMPQAHSSWVGSISLTKACRWRTRAWLTWRVRGSVVFWRRRSVSWVNVSSFRSRIARLPPFPASAGTFRSSVETSSTEPGFPAAVERFDFRADEARHVALHIIANARLQIGQMPIPFGKTFKKRLVEIEGLAGIEKVQTVLFVDGLAQ